MTEKISEKMEVTKEMLIKALKNSHDFCSGDCVHAKAFDICLKNLEESTLITLLGSGSLPPALALLVEGIHIGFTLRELYDTEVLKHSTIQ